MTRTIELMTTKISSKGDLNDQLIEYEIKAQSLVEDGSPMLGDTTNGVQLANMLLASLDKNFESFVQGIEAQESEALTFLQLKEKLLSWEQRHRSAYKQDEEASKPLAYQTVAKSPERGKSKKYRCSHCNRSGHTEEKCWILHPELKPKNQGQQRQRVAKGMEVAHKVLTLTRLHPLEKTSRRRTF